MVDGPHPLDESDMCGNENGTFMSHRTLMSPFNLTNLHLYDG